MSLELREREFRPGTTGWSVHDLEDPLIERLWETHHYEIVDGVLTEMPPAAFEGGVSLFRLATHVQAHLSRRGIKSDWGPEVDFIVADERIAKPDVMMLLDADKRRQLAANAKIKSARRKLKYGRIRVAPTLIIESISPGHEHHDRSVKRRWYAEFGVKNYWILDASRRTLECLVLEKSTYKLDVMGRNSEKIKPAAFAGLVVPLAKLWV